MSILENEVETNQALNPPLDELVLVETHVRLVRLSVKWSDVGILIDENSRGTLILLLQDNEVVSIFRICLSVDDSVSVIDQLREKNGKIFFGCWQGHELSREQICSQKEINNIWQRIPDQIREYSTDDVRSFFVHVEADAKLVGRGTSMGSDTKRAVMHASHGRCMFEGCGEDLGFDQLTGADGNFSYLAHNVASSEKGPRGVVGLSGKLSDDPSNVLLLCDKHHRLVDKIAAADYPAERLSSMRRNFSETVDMLLDGLTFQPIPAFAVLWPVNGQTISCPSRMQIAQCFSRLHSRLDSQIMNISDNEESLRNGVPDRIAADMPSVISRAAERIIMQAHGAGYRAGLFAFGLMPPLIALGAMLGNKSEIVPMLRYRDGGQWTWPSDTPQGKFYEITGIAELSESEEEVVLIFALTNDPKPANDIAKILEDEKNVKTVKIRAFDVCMGNGALSHPEDGQEFSMEIQVLLHDLVDKHNVKIIHLLPCASNAACVFFGKGYDRHHPDILVYDFANGSMEPQLLISNDTTGCIIKPANIE